MVMLILPAHFVCNNFPTYIHKNKHIDTLTQTHRSARARKVCRSKNSYNSIKSTPPMVVNTEHRSSTPVQNGEHRTNHNIHNVIAHLVALVCYYRNIRHWERKYLSSPHDIRSMWMRSIRKARSFHAFQFIVNKTHKEKKNTENPTSVPSGCLYRVQNVSRTLLCWILCTPNRFAHCTLYNSISCVFSAFYI